MGYILPIQNFQSQQYAERMNNQPHNFAYIDRISPVRLNNEESNYWEDVLQEEDRRHKEQMEERNMKRAPQSLAKNGFIAPNPAKLSPAIAEVVGKGLSINAYV
ncbi:hypothetical protein ORD22_01275 [Sporosarcina sp. GW1-11]|uniref:hypothetical protein n=1 Tax=Sporosarcina sp. GW1-11 TaxID=2899126 RepID=UPI00294E1B7F|nr:hypothetical protein [Sporosarcina sp. GW1-11]MDV6376895.1 hypothetical protein [Sporosarcina sp. GW1-11]